MAATGYLALALPFAAAALAPLLTRFLRHNAAWVLALFPLAAFVIFARQLGAVSSGEVLLFGFDWIPTFDIRFSFRLDGLSSTFALLVTGIGTLIVIYAGGYLKGHRDQGRFLSFILMFMGAMLGLVLADDLIALFVYWELTSITSFLLIGFDHERERARRGAIQALVITGGGGLILLAGFVLIRETTGLGSTTEILAAGEALRENAAYVPILILVLFGAFTKSAQMPFHIWLPNAMEAPTPVSAYLHSATMVKAGVYLLMRLHPALGDTYLWTTILPVFGGVTLVLGAVLAIQATDIKITLAYTTLASLGLLVMLIGVGTDTSIIAATLYLVAHSLFKGGLFMVAGSIDHGAHTRDINRLGGLRPHLPITFAAALLCALSMGGITPFVGFLAKEEIYHALETADVYHLALLAAAIIGNAGMFAAAFIVALKPFSGDLPDHIDHPHESGVMVWAGPLLLGVLGLVGGLFYGSYHALFTSPMASATLGTPATIGIGWVPHLNVAFALSLLTVAIGVGIYWGADRVRAALQRGSDAIGWGPDHGFDQAMRGLLQGAVRITGIIQSGRLDYYMTITLAVTTAALLGSMYFVGGFPALPSFPDIAFYEGAVVALLVAGIAAVVCARGRLTAIVSLGIQGFAVALLFMLLGAPDVSFTQFMVEILSVVILALVMTRLKLSVSDHRPLRELVPDATIAIAGGTAFGLLLMSVTQQAFDSRLSDFFSEYSYAIAHGRNIVNVILVDFRGIDTLGEIAVVMTTGLAVLALIRIKAQRPRKPASKQGAAS